MPMPDMVIAQVERLGHTNATPNMFDFLDRNGVLFEWSKDVNETPKGIIKKDVVLYPFLAAETPGIVLEQDQPIPSMEDEMEPQGRAKDAAAQNANLEPINAAGVHTLTIIHANANEIDNADDNNDGILSIATIPQGLNNLHPRILHNSLDEEQAEGDDDDENKEDNDNDKDNDDKAMIDHAARPRTKQKNNKNQECAGPSVTTEEQTRNMQTTPS